MCQTIVSVKRVKKTSFHTRAMPFRDFSSSLSLSLFVQTRKFIHVYQKVKKSFSLSVHIPSFSRMEAIYVLAEPDARTLSSRIFILEFEISRLYHIYTQKSKALNRRLYEDFIEANVRCRGQLQKYPYIYAGGGYGQARKRKNDTVKQTEKLQDIEIRACVSFCLYCNQTFIPFRLFLRVLFYMLEFYIQCRSRGVLQKV